MRSKAQVHIEEERPRRQSSSKKTKSPSRKKKEDGISSPSGNGKAGKTRGARGKYGVV